MQKIKKIYNDTTQQSVLEQKSALQTNIMNKSTKIFPNNVYVVCRNP